MEERKEQSEPLSEHSTAQSKRVKVKLSLVPPRSYTLEELPAVLEQMRHAEPDPKEIARRTRIFKRMERLRATLPPIDVDELLRRVEEDMTNG